MMKITPIINTNKNNEILDFKNPKITLEDNIVLTPILNSTEFNNKPEIELKIKDIKIEEENRALSPILNKNENEIILEMNGIGPMGPKGERGENGANGNGILRIEKTKTENLIDYYTIYFTNGETFEYQITNGVVHYYDGDYEITPMPYTSQILPTANLIMRDNINIQEIPYYEVSNLSGGITATIGDIN